MNPLCSVPFSTPSKWVVNMLNITKEEVIEFADCMSETSQNDIEHIEIRLQCSEIPSETISTIIHINYIINTNHKNKELCLRMINNISESRWLEMMHMSVDIMRECIRLFKYFNSPPSLDFIIGVGELMHNDLTSIELMLDAFLILQMPLTIEFAFIVQNSYTAWKLLHRLNIGCYDSKELLTMIFNQSTKQNNLWMTYGALISVNGSCLEYLMHIDVLYGKGIKQTIDTINGFNLWEIFLKNSAASPIIDFALEHYYTIKFGAFHSKESMLEWIIPRIGASPLVKKYVTINYINEKKVNQDFFQNPHAIDLILQWLNEDNINSSIIDGLVIIASSNNYDAAMKAIQLIDSDITIGGYQIIDLINDSQWIILLKSPFARPFVESQLLEDNLQYSIIDIIRAGGIVPYWVPVLGEDMWELTNLSPETVQNIYLDYEFYEQTRYYVDYLTYDNWSILLNTEFGVSLGIGNIGYVIDCGVLFRLLGSPYMTNELLNVVDESTDAFDHAGEEEFISIINRDDAYEIDLNQVFKSNFAMCQEIITTWFNPDRLKRYSNACNMDIRSYLTMME